MVARVQVSLQAADLLYIWIVDRCYYCSVVLHGVSGHCLAIEKVYLSFWKRRTIQPYDEHVYRSILLDVSRPVSFDDKISELIPTYYYGHTQIVQSDLNSAIYINITLVFKKRYFFLKKDINYFKEKRYIKLAKFVYYVFLSKQFHEERSLIRGNSIELEAIILSIILSIYSKIKVHLPATSILRWTHRFSSDHRS